jgi:hypothetical protein
MRAMKCEKILHMVFTLPKEDWTANAATTIKHRMDLMSERTVSIYPGRRSNDKGDWRR